MTRPEIPIVLRPMAETDRAFVVNSWLLSFATPQRCGSCRAEYPRTLRKATYYEEYHALVSQLLERAVVTVACDVEHADQIYGWLCVEPRSRANVVHYAFVKQPFRALGVLRRLVASLPAADGLVYTFHSRAATTLAPKLGAQYNPFLALRRSR